jgi:hypothetical protein
MDKDKVAFEPTSPVTSEGFEKTLAIWKVISEGG